MDKSEAPHNLNTTLLRTLSAAVNGHAATATFACGGSVPVVDDKLLEPGKPAISPPVKIRWDDDLQNNASITFPPPQEDAAFRERLQALLHKCDPATFGLGGQDVLDEQYRKASKLDTSQFSSNFHPHDCGILDSVQQVLLPSTVNGGLTSSVAPQLFKAELYKLNIYSAPSGKFRPHVDTPRGPTQFGSLVVCLPSQHEGGILRVKHRDQTMEFDWANADPHCIHWAAFYGDCEHEVLEVTSGHRVTLTYNLFHSPASNIDHGMHIPHQLPLHSMVRDMLQEPTFMRDGGTLGFFCQHQYAHAHDSGRESLPHAFKGVDLAIYSVFRSLDLKIDPRPIIKDWYNDAYYGGMSSKELLDGSHDPSEGDHVEMFFDKRKGDWEIFLGEEEFSWEKAFDDWDYKDRHTDYLSKTSVVGTAMHKTQFDEYEEHMKGDIVPETWPHKRVSNIVWMNEPTHQDLAYAGVVYGNQAQLNYHFSAAALLVTIPPSNERSSRAPIYEPPTTRTASDHLTED